VTAEVLETFDLRRWLEAVAPVVAISTNEHAPAVLFRNLVRAEIHFGSLAMWISLQSAVSESLIDLTERLPGRPT
jgi:hypothetical protein